MVNKHKYNRKLISNAAQLYILLHNFVYLDLIYLNKSCYTKLHGMAFSVGIVKNAQRSITINFIPYESRVCVRELDFLYFPSVILFYRIS